MRKPTTWGAGTNAIDIREAARDAARREGLSLSAWLAQAIAQHALEIGVDPAEMNEDERFDAVTARLRQLGVRGLRNISRRAAARWPAAERLEAVAAGGKTRSRARPSWPSPSADPEQDADALLDDAVAQLGSRGEVEQLTERLDRLEAELAERTESGRVPPVHSALARLEAQLDSLGGTSAQATQPSRGTEALMPPFYSEQLERVESKVNALLQSLGSSTAVLSKSGAKQGGADGTSARRPSLADAVAEIARHQRALETPGVSRREEQRINGERFLRRRPESLRNRAYRHDAAGSEALASLRGDIASLAGKVDEIRREQAARAATPPTCNLDKLRGEIATMSVALRDLASRGSLAPLESAIRNLTEQIESSRTEGLREAVLRPLERLVADLRQALADIDPRTTIRGLEGEVQKLGSKLDDLGKRGLDPLALGKIDDRTREIRELLAAPAAPFERIEHQLAALADRFDEMRSRAGGQEDGDLEAVADELRSIMSAPSQPILAKIEAQLEALGAKVEEAISEARDESRYTALANRINDVHAELAESIAHRAHLLDQDGLEALVRGLAERLEQARRPEADSRAIEALQRQLSEFAARLDRANVGAPSLVSLEQSMGDLFAELERTREASYEAAEKAARNVLREALANTASGALHPDLTQDLDHLRREQDEAGRRTLDTLNAVHETLEKVVDRLAVVESELADVRGEKPAELLASGPAPNFAPAPRDQSALAADKEGAVLRPQPRRPATAGGRGKAEPTADSLEDFLIEPGRGFPGRRSGAERSAAVAADQFEGPDAAAGRAGFIAAARRAAQAAQLESAAALGRQAGSAATGSAGSTGLLMRTRNFVAHHKRPVVLSIAALFLALGAYAVIKTAGHIATTDPVPAQSGKEAPTHPVAPSKPALPAQHSERKSRLPTAQPSAVTPAPSAARAPASHASAAPAVPPGADPIVTGTIGANPPAPSFELLQRLAQTGNAKAQYELASLYAKGQGRPRDLSLAAHWYEKAALQGLAPAQYRLGSLYEKGLGVERSLTRAASWYRKAAEAGNIRAMHNLAVLTAEGGDSGKPDYATAAQWFRKAAEYGVRDSQYNLAILFARGLGVPQNLALSYKWFAVVAAQGDEDAAKKRDDVGARLSAADLIAAKATAAVFRAKIPDPAANEVAPPPGGWAASAVQSRHMTRPKLSES